MKVRITKFSQRDSARHFHSAGEVGEGNIENWSDGWSYCRSFTFENGDVWPLFEFKYEPVPEYSIEYPGGTMNQDGTVIRMKAKQESPFSSAYQPRRKTWLQKIRDYDGLDAAYDRVVSRHNKLMDRFIASEAMLSEALHDRDLHATVADVWQQRLICVQKDLMDATEMIGKRLKFSVGHNHVTIIVGNPVTACYFVEKINGDEYDDNFFCVSICHKNDTFDWKRGVVESLENMIHNWLGSAYGDPADYFNTLFTAYPEIGIQPVVRPVKKTKKAK